MGTPSVLAEARKRLGFAPAPARPVRPRPAPPPPPPADGPLDAADNPHRLAAGYLATLATGGPARLRFWRGEYLDWRDGAYRAVPDADMRCRLTEYVRAAMLAANADDRAAWSDRGGGKGGPPKVRPVTVKLVNDVLNALRGLCLLPSDTDPPAWVGGATGPDPANVIALRNGLFDIPAGRLLPPSPAFFTLGAVPFDFDPDAPPPAAWLAFLASVWGDDPESIAALQEWFGYLLGGDTRQQKMLFLVGPKRAGKGTVARVLKGLIGERNFAGPTLNGLTMNFGLAPLLGKTVALIDDARLGGRADAAVVVERLLTITGEGTITIDRKNREPVDAKLPTRFVMLSNELPRFGDSSGALAGRMILLRLTRTFYGGEDTGLTDRLLGELPGVLNWSLAGWRRLTERGRFVQPASGAELLADLEDLASPVGAFVREECVIEPAGRTPVAELFRAWRAWCEGRGRKEPGTEQTFGRDLRAAVPSLQSVHRKASGERWREYVGIRLRSSLDPDPASDDEPAPARRLWDGYAAARIPD